MVDYDVLTMDAVLGVYCSGVRAVMALNDEIEDAEFITSEDMQSSECFQFQLPRELLIAECKRMDKWLEVYPCDVTRCGECDEPRDFQLKTAALA